MDWECSALQEWGSSFLVPPRGRGTQCIPAPKGSFRAGSTQGYTGGFLLEKFSLLWEEAADPDLYPSVLMHFTS